MYVRIRPLTGELRSTQIGLNIELYLNMKLHCKWPL